MNVTCAPLPTSSARATTNSSPPLERHPWRKIPGRLIFDFDPAPGVVFADAVAVALDLRRHLRTLGPVPFCKTANGKGLHVVTPLTADESHDTGWSSAKKISRQVCIPVVIDRADKYSVSMPKKLANERIHLD